MFNKKYPFLTLNTSIIVLRVAVACMFLAHAIGRIIAGTIPGFGGFLETIGFPMGVVLVWLITIFEIVASLLLIVGFLKKWAALGLILLLATGIVIIHVKLGWYNGEFNTGGCEYSVTLIAALIVIASSDDK